MTGIGAASASAATAPPRPRSASTGGWMPRTRSRSSDSAVLDDVRASASSARAWSGSVSSCSSAIARLMPSATSRACAPSCRSRSMRRSSAACASTVSVRVSVRCSTRWASRLFSDSAEQRAVEMCVSASPRALAAATRRSGRGCLRRGRSTTAPARSSRPRTATAGRDGPPDHRPVRRCARSRLPVGRRRYGDGIVRPISAPE